MTQDKAIAPQESTYQERAKEELESLFERIEKLAAAINNYQSLGIPLEELGRMSRQLDHMNAYAKVLTDRITNF